jgi:hypothetical protein
VTPHTHPEFVPGCYRCELDLDLVRDAAGHWLEATDGFPDEVQPHDVPTRLRLAAAWLDFYDETFVLIERAIGRTESFWPLPRDELQENLRELATAIEIAGWTPPGEEARP